jgi:ABC-type Zn uptake system ZnuABC Zn-binding protein ZnuA
MPFLSVMGTGEILITVAILGLLGGCAPPKPDRDRVSVVATVSPITNLVENVSGESVDLVGLVPEGVNSHTFEPAPSDARILADANLIFMNGLRLEEPTRKLAQANLTKGAAVIELGSRSISRSEWIFDFSFPEAEGDPNPHVWTNPLYAKRFLRSIETELANAYPPAASRFRRNRAAFEKKIDDLDKAVRTATSSIASERRKLLTYHDSFPYFAREYGWRVVGAIQPSDFSEPTARDVTRLIEQIKGEGVTAIFGSEVFPSPVLEQIARETGARYVDELRDDDLPGEPGDPEHSYLGLMRFDFVTMVEALGGDASALKSLDISNVVNGGADYR